MLLGTLSVLGRGMPQIWITEGQGLVALAVGAVGGCLGNFYVVYLFSFFLPLWETARYRLKCCLKGPLNSKQPTNPNGLQQQKFELPLVQGRIILPTASFSRVAKKLTTVFTKGY